MSYFHDLSSTMSKMPFNRKLSAANQCLHVMIRSIVSALSFAFNNPNWRVVNHDCTLFAP